METAGPPRFRQPKDRPKKPEKQVYVPPCLKKGNFKEGRGVGFFCFVFSFFFLTSLRVRTKI